MNGDGTLLPKKSDPKEGEDCRQEIVLCGGSLRNMASVGTVLQWVSANVHTSLVLNSRLTPC